MFLDHNSLLLAAGVAACTSSLTFLVSYLSDRSSGLLAIAGATMLLIALYMGGLVFFSVTSNPAIGAMSCAVLLIALTLAFSGAHEFRLGYFPTARTMVVISTLMVASATLYLLEHQGATFVFTDAASAVLLALTAREYWLCRQESPAIITIMFLVYIAISVAFAACMVVLLIDMPAVLNGPPDNWVEITKTAIAILSITGVAALSITLNHNRLIRQHRKDAQTDPLTGVLNRRALFDRFGKAGLPHNTAVIAFDLDHFKSINDGHDHATGDKLLVIFADLCLKRSRQSDMVMRLGGEEFAIVLLDTTNSAALAIAEAIRIAFAKQVIEAEGQQVSCTVSVGVHLNDTGAPQYLSKALHSADNALYSAKRDGRNLVRIYEYEYINIAGNKNAAPRMGAA